MGLLLDASEARRTAELFAEVWGVADGPMPISGDLIRALVHTGNYAAGAWAGTDLVGASVAFLALDNGRLSLHSHITGVARAARGGSVGFALKQHQRAWALSHGIREVTWTFDPLVRGNARFNLVKLGAVAVSYLVDFYGQMEDGVNAGDRSDRCAVRWELDTPRAVAASEGRRPARPARPAAPFFSPSARTTRPPLIGHRRIRQSSRARFCARCRPTSWPCGPRTRARPGPGVMPWATPWVPPWRPDSWPVSSPVTVGTF